MKIRYLLLTFALLLVFAGCFKEKQELTPQEVQGIFEQAKEIYAQNKGKTNTASNGIMLGIYLKDSNGDTRVYEFADFFDMTESQTNEFIASWGNCVPENSYVIFSDDKAVTIKSVRDNDGSFYNAKTASVVTLSNTGYTKDSIVTDGMSNLKEYADEEGPKVTFSSASGNIYINTGVTLSTVSGGAIRYSEDNSKVTETSTQYSTALNISADKAIRAKAYVSGWVEGKEYTESYSVCYKMKYNAGISSSGYVPAGESLYRIGTGATVLPNTGTLSKRGYEFTGWNTAADGKGTSYTVGNSITMNADIVLYPAYTEITIEKIIAANTQTYILCSDGSLWGAGSDMNGIIAANTKDSLSGGFYKIGENIKDAACGNEHLMYITEDGKLYGMGSNSYGQLGISAIGGTYNEPQLVASGVTQVSCGSNHTGYITEYGELYVMGNNSFHQLGIEGITNQYSPTIIHFPFIPIKVVCGSNHTIVLMADRTLYGMGNNGFGQLGLGNTISYSTPQRIPISNVKEIACGNNYTMCIDESGWLYGTGLNLCGQLGTGDITNRESFSVISTGMVEKVFCGWDYTMYMSEIRLWYGMGNNIEGQLGIGGIAEAVTFSRIIPMGMGKEVACGAGHTVILKEDGTLYGVGNNSSNQLGNRASASSYNFQDMGFDLKGY